MFVHKYTADGDTFYRISKEPKPGEVVTLSPDTWQGRRQTSSGRISTAIGILSGAFSQKEEETEKEPKEKGSEKEAGIHSVAGLIRSITE